MGDEPKPAAGERGQAVVHPHQMRAQQIWHVPWNVEGHDLPPAVAHDLEPLRKPLQQQAALRRTVAFVDDVLVRPDLADVHWHVEKRLLLVVRERAMSSNLRMR